MVYPLSKHVWDISQYYLAGVESCDNYPGYTYYRADSRLALSQWETLLQSNTASHWLGKNLESALYYGDGCLLRLRRKLLRSSTRMRLPILNSVRAWAKLFHVSASRGLRPISAEPQSGQGGTMEQSSTWAKICHFSEVGHWSRSLAAFFFRKFLGD